MKKFFVIVSLFVLSLPLFSEQIEFPKNNDPLEIEKSIRYYDDSDETAYKLYAVTYKTDSVNLIGLHVTKTSLLTNVETELLVKFETEDELDGFINWSYIEAEYTLDEIPDYFSHLKKYISSMGIKPYYILDENDNPKRIVYVAVLTKNS